jgi:hypothetical protein
VKPGGTCYVKVEVAVMHAVKPPEEWNLVIRPMPYIGKKIEEN